jgi:hypothetical protein
MADLRNAVREIVEIFGKARGYAIAPRHNTQPVIPTQNALTLYKGAQEYGKV